MEVDEAALSGGNTQDVCVYFSTDGADGTAERAICYQIVSDAAGNVASEELTYWQCPPGTSPTRPGWTEVHRRREPLLLTSARRRTGA